MACKVRRIVDSLGVALPRPSRARTAGAQIVRPFRDRGEAARPSQHRTDPDRENRDEPMADTAARPRIVHRGQRLQQPDWHRSGHGRPRLGLVDNMTDRQRCAGGHGARSGDRAGVGTAMITSGAVSAPLLPHHRRVSHRHAATPDFAEAPGSWMSGIPKAIASQIVSSDPPIQPRNLPV